jgi:hypothetical protein
MSPSLAKAISSAGPDNGTFCTLYSDYDCHGLALPFTNPGVIELKRYNCDDVVLVVRGVISLRGGRIILDESGTGRSDDGCLQ